MSPPGELILTVTSLSPIARSAAETRFAVTPPPVHQSSPITSNMVMVSSSLLAAMGAVSAHFASTSLGASHWKFCGRWKVRASGNLRRLIAIILSGFVAAGGIRRIVVLPTLAIGAWVHVLEGADLVGVVDTPLQRLHIG